MSWVKDHYAAKGICSEERPNCSNRELAIAHWLTGELFENPPEGFKSAEDLKGLSIVDFTKEMKYRPELYYFYKKHDKTLPTDLTPTAIWAFMNDDKLWNLKYNQDILL